MTNADGDVSAVTFVGGHISKAKQQQLLKEITTTNIRSSLKSLIVATGGSCGGD